MNMKIKYSILILCVWCVCSCNDYLDVVPDNMPVIDHAFNNRAMAERYLFTCYSYLPNPADLNNYPALMASRELWVNLTKDFGYYFLNNSGEKPLAFEIARGLQNANNPYLNFWDGGNGGTNLFIALRDCNIFLENIHKALDLEEYERARWVAEVKFLKAFYHFFLLRSYGPIPIVDQNILVSASVEEVRVYREPVEKVADYIVSLLDEIAEDLPRFIEIETTDMGRVTKPMALALKAKVLTLIASPLFNGNPYYRDMIDNRGIHLFPSTSDPTKWQTAAQAIKDAIDCAHDAGHALYYFDGSNLVSDDTKAKLNIRGAVTERWNREVIWGSTKNNDQLQGVSVVITSTTQQQNQRISSMMSPTLDVAERFYSKNGVPIEEDKYYDYENRYRTGIVSADHRYFLQERFETVKLHLNREPRFYASLFFDGCAIYGNSIASDNPSNIQYAQMKLGQLGGFITDRGSITGYLPQKLVNVATVVANPSTFSPYRYAFPYIRLADLYLMYAEALNETQSAPDGKVYFWINEVRKRASLNDVEVDWRAYSNRPDKYTTQNGMREIIRRERLIELACEGETYWDLLRWLEAEKIYNKPIRGWNVYGENTGDYYNIRAIAPQSFGIKDYLTPISQHSLDVNSNLIQNTGW